ncbi:MAG: penicillin-binding transpeptidase domain-containing protein, partial [Anaerovoracaceae bacterium]|nr:penicillin-binding transpeptidase domain-containing protein [Anaerovoracaceae bacterium]
YTSLDPKAQSAIEDMFKENGNFPSVANLKKDSSGNLLNSDGNVMLYNYDNYIDSSGNFTLGSSEFSTDSEGNVTLKKGKRLIFEKVKYRRRKTAYAIEFKNMYRVEDGAFYVLEGGEINIDGKYKSLDSDGNLVIDASFFRDNPGALIRSGSGITVPESMYSLSPQVRQPQAAMVIINNKTGAVSAMVGGRSESGSMLYNRAENPRQPGSSIKPLAIYSSALQLGAEAVKDNRKMTFTDFGSNTNAKYYGNYWTARSYINDAPLTINGKVWPKNWYSGYRGEVSLRTAVEQSINVCAVRVWQQMDDEYITDQLEKFGITTVVKDDGSGDANDMNAAALALGGMTKGVSPLEMASAYSTFQNGGTHIEYSAYTRGLEQDGTVVLDKAPKKTKVMDEGVAFIMSDILHTTVTRGIAGNAQVSGQPTAGKTGTTTDNYDAWFCGFTPQYSAALWIGNDYNIELSQGSAAAARLWSRIMSRATAGMSGSFAKRPSSVIYYNGEYFISGTQRGSYYRRRVIRKKENETDRKNATPGEGGAGQNDQNNAGNNGTGGNQGAQP